MPRRTSTFDVRRRRNSRQPTAYSQMKTLDEKLSSRLSTFAVRRSTKVRLSGEVIPRWTFDDQGAQRLADTLASAVGCRLSR